MAPPRRAASPPRAVPALPSSGSAPPRLSPLSVVGTRATPMGPAGDFSQASRPVQPPTERFAVTFGALGGPPRFSAGGDGYQTSPEAMERSLDTQLVKYLTDVHSIEEQALAQL